MDVQASVCGRRVFFHVYAYVCVNVKVKVLLYVNVLVEYVKMYTECLCIHVHI